MALIVSCLMLISILFEHAQEAIREATGPEMRPVLDAMLSEMTLLGFIGLLMFVLEQSEFLDLSEDTVRALLETTATTRRRSPS